MTISSTAPTVTGAGISAPSYSEILAYLVAQYQLIYGSDVYLGSDSQDGQFLGIVALAISDANSAAVAVYSAFSPATAQQNSLSSGVKINGITRHVPTNSTVTVTIVGTAGTAITNGVAQDTAKNSWNLPVTVNIPNAGTIDVTATAAVAGATLALANTVTTILTPQLGWQSVNNAGAATAGAPVESDAQLRQRQAASVAQPGQSPLVGVIGAVAAVSGVTRFSGLENPTGSVDGNGLPAHSLSMVVEGGSLTDIAAAIANYKTVGALTYGTTTEQVMNSYGITEPISFYVVGEVRIIVGISLHAISGYTTAIGTEIKAAVAAYINAIAIGGSVKLTRLYGPANLNGSADGQTYEITVLQIAVFGNALGNIDVPIAFNQAAQCNVSDITLTLV